MAKRHYDWKNTLNTQSLRLPGKEEPITSWFLAQFPRVWISWICGNQGHCLHHGWPFNGYQCTRVQGHVFTSIRIHVFPNESPFLFPKAQSLYSVPHTGFPICSESGKPTLPVLLSNKSRGLLLHSTSLTGMEEAGPQWHHLLVNNACNALPPRNYRISEPEERGRVGLSFGASPAWDVIWTRLYTSWMNQWWIYDLASEQTPSEAGCWADATPELNSRWVTEAEQLGDNFLRAWVCPQKPECPFFWAVVVSKIAVQHGPGFHGRYGSRSQFRSHSHYSPSETWSVHWLSDFVPIPWRLWMPVYYSRLKFEEIKNYFLRLLRIKCAYVCIHSVLCFVSGSKLVFSKSKLFLCYYFYRYYTIPLNLEDTRLRGLT